MTTRTPWRPVKIMAEVSNLLRDSDTALPASAITVLVHGPPRLVRQAIAALIVEGHVVEATRDETASPMLHLVEPFPPTRRRARPATAETLVEVLYEEITHLIGSYYGARVARDSDELARIGDEIRTARAHLEIAADLLEPPATEETTRG